MGEPRSGVVTAPIDLSAGTRPGVGPRHTAVTGPPAPRAGDRLPVPRRKRQPVLAVVALLLTVGCAAVFGTVALGKDKHTDYLKLTVPVNAGHVIVASDLGVVSASSVTGMRAYLASGAAQMVGETVVTNLPAGAILTEGMVATTPFPPAGQQIVGVALKVGNFPPQLTSGRDVSVISLATAVPTAVSAAGASAAPAATTTSFVLIPKARVLSLSTDPSSGATLLSMLVSDADAAMLSRAAVQGTISVTLLPVAP